MAPLHLMLKSSSSRDGTESMRSTSLAFTRAAIEQMRCT